MTEMCESLLVYAARNYTTRGASTFEFLEDYKRLASITRSINRFTNVSRSKPNIRLLLNQIVMLSNAFGVESATEMLLRKTSEENLGVLFPLLIFLGYLSEEQLSRITVEFDDDIVNMLRGI